MAVTPAEILARYPEAHRLVWQNQERATPLEQRLRAVLPILRALPRAPMDPSIVLALIKQESDVKRWAFNRCCHGIAQINITNTGVMEVDPYMPSQVIPWVYRRLVRLSGRDTPRDARKMLSRYMEPYGPERGRGWNYTYADAVLARLPWARSVMTDGNNTAPPSGGQGEPGFALQWPRSARYIWRPDAATLAAGRVASSRVAKTRVNPIARVGEEVQLTPFPAARPYMSALCAKFGLQPGGVKRSPAKGVARIQTARDPHEQGYAFDAYTSGDAGAALASRIIRNAERLQFQLVIFANTMWVAQSPRPWQAGSDKDSGSARHENHLHIELSPASRLWTPAQINTALEGMVP